MGAILDALRPFTLQIPIERRTTLKFSLTLTQPAPTGTFTTKHGDISTMGAESSDHP
ncbi:hypothetical protein SAMN02745225_01109 [Ferrithrix thermotolerans DSM 19514]|uniref:Uncharacterized protein n=1 Tax=Ferrithrix thermotolerans DSM 19514 TaxID=1121881 RepID=A0A1M4UVR1_9ACTN|nr:hypothetical protein SAMN02745225_01109 [Ferrithrix thermotolerans DSM 19514]